MSDGLYNWVQDGEINIFDSFPAALTSDLMNQIAALLTTPKDAIKVKYIDTQMQSGSTDVASLLLHSQLALANGEPPGALIFNQPEMRKHLMECLELQLLSAFPIMRKRRRANKVKLVSPVPIYCSCRMPEQAGNTLIQCSTCKEWFAVPPEAFDSGTRWFCNNCT